MKVEADNLIEAVPEVVLEAFIQQQAGYRMTRIRVEGRRYELASLLQEFQMQVTIAQNINHQY